jgi:predicted PurR-regulated permease PerM
MTNSRFVQRCLIATSIVMLATSAVLLLVYARTFFLLLFAGILFGAFLRASASWITKMTKMPKGLSLTLVLLMLLGLTTLLVILIAPTVGEQITEIRRTLPESLADIEEWLKGFELGRRALEQTRQAMEGMGGAVDVAGAAGVLSSTLGVITDILIVTVIGIFFAADPETYRRGIVKMFPPNQRERISEVIYDSYKTLVLWLFGKFLTMLIVGILSWVGLAIMGVPLAFGLAIIAFFLDFIPNVGPILAAIPAMLIAFTISPVYSLYVAVLYFVIQSIESYIFVPIIFKKTVSISPVLTLMSIVFFGILAGALGVILATPLVAVIQKLVNELYVKDYLEKPDVEIVQAS